MSSTDFEVHVDEPEVLVVGAGQAGLAIGYELRERDLSFQIVDAADEIGAVWRSRWDSLRLFTADQYNSLPGMDFPAAADTYPGKEVADFLRAYVARFDLPVRLNTRVHSLSKAAGGYLADTNNGALAAREVVVATGPFQAPHIPPIADRLAPDVAQMQPLAGEVADERARARVGEHPLHLTIEHDRIFQAAAAGDVQQFLVRHTAPEEE